MLNATNVLESITRSVYPRPTSIDDPFSDSEAQGFSHCLSQHDNDLEFGEYNLLLMAGYPQAMHFIPPMIRHSIDNDEYYYDYTELLLGFIGIYRPAITADSMLVPILEAMLDLFFNCINTFSILKEFSPDDPCYVKGAESRDSILGCYQSIPYIRGFTLLDIASARWAQTINQPSRSAHYLDYIYRHQMSRLDDGRDTRYDVYRSIKTFAYSNIDIQWNSARRVIESIASPEYQRLLLSQIDVSPAR